MSIGVYIIENTLTGHIYIGSSSTSIEKRWGYHIKDLKSNKHHSNRLQNSWNKYGSEAFQFKVLSICDSDSVIKKEQFYIDVFEPEFNMNPVAGNCSGRKFSEESKQKMSESAKKRGLNIYLLNQQKIKSVFNENGDKKCCKCLNFKDIKFFKKGNKCNSCFNEDRPSRAVIGARQTFNKKRSFGLIIAKSDIQTLEFDSLRDAERFFRSNGHKLNKTHLKTYLDTEKQYYGYTWERKPHA